MTLEPWRPLALFLAVLSVVLHTDAGRSEARAATPLWQLGVFDESSNEFFQWIHPTTGERQIDYSSPASDAVFVVGTSDPSRHWPAYHPGSANGATGFRQHPARLEFVLPREPDSDLELHVGLLAYSARLPILQVSANGRTGWFHQQPRLAYSGGDSAVFFQPHYATSRIRARLPKDLFRAGTNQLVLTAIDLPGDREDVRPSGFPFPGCSGLVYDALALAPIDPQQSDVPPSTMTVEATPTIFHRHRDGRLLAEIDVVVTFPDSPPRGRLTFEMAGHTVSAVLANGHERERLFGEVRAILEVPAWDGVRSALLRIESGGTSREFRRDLRAARRWTVWVVPHEHLDIGYTDYDAKVAELHSRVMDDAIALAARHRDFTFTADGFWVVEQYLAGRTPEARAGLLSAIRNGRVRVPVVHGSLFTGSASLEGMIRALYPSRRFAREHGTRFDTAIVTDVPSYSWSWASVLAAAGVKYFVGASDAYRGPFLLRNRLHELGPHSWEGPDGGRVTTWYSRHYHQFSSLFGLPPRLSLGRDSLPRFLQAYDRPEYASDEVLLYGSQVENVALQPDQADFPEAWNREYAFPRLRIGGFGDALDSITRGRPPRRLVRGDGGPYWEDGLAANARITALARENNRRLVSAEKLATLASVWNPRVRVGDSDLESAWHAVRLIDEHTWHADCSVRDPESEQARKQGEAKDARAFEARRALERVLQRSLSAIADTVPAGPGSLLVFNPSSWPRRGVVEVELGRGLGLVDPASGQLVPCQVLREGRVYQRVRFLAPEVSSLGYRAFALRPVPVAARKPPAGVSLEPPALANRFYHVELDVASGGIRRILDRDTGREWVAADSPYRLGQWLYVTGGDALPNRIVQFSSVTPLPELTVHPAGNGRLLAADDVGWALSARLESAAPFCPRIETEILLPKDRKEIRLALRVSKLPSLAKEAAYVAFPLGAGTPTFRYAIQNGIVDPAQDILPGGGQEWFTLHDWIAASDPSGSFLIAPLDAPLVTLGDIVRGHWPESFGVRPANVFSYVMSNYTPEGYAASQGGDFLFRYVLTSSRDFDPAVAARWGAEASIPLECVEITRSDKLLVATSPAQLDPVRGEGLVVSPASVHLSAWKHADVGSGTIVRLVETAGVATEARLHLPGRRILRSTRCNAVEDAVAAPIPAESDGSIRIGIPAFGIVTSRIEVEVD